MVGIPMDRVGTGVVECGCYSTANGIAFRGVVWGTLCTLNPSVVPNFSPRSGFCMRLPTAIFFSGCCLEWLQSWWLFWYTCVAIISLDSGDGGERVSCGTRSPVRWE